VQDRARKTRRAFIEAAAQRFGAYGFERTSVQDIIDAAGATKGAFYFHFSSKESLAEAIMTMEGSIWSPMAEHVRSTETSGVQGLIDFSYEAACRLVQDPVVWVGAQLRLLDGGLLGQPISLTQTTWFFILMEFLTRARELGELRDLELPDAAEVLLETFIGLQLMSQSSSEHTDLKRRLAVMWRTVLPMLVEEDRRTTYRVTPPAPLSCKLAPDVWSAWNDRDSLPASI
jgi:AcrR family transcriptional regulator